MTSNNDIVYNNNSDQIQMNTINYNEFDTLKIYVKKDKAEEIINYYQILKWSLYEQKENDKYEDTIDITFIRPHKISNKDDLQLLQVHLEHKINQIGQIEKYKHVKSSINALSLGVISLTLILFSVLGLIKQINIDTIFCFCMLVISVILISTIIIWLPKNLKKEKLRATHRISQLNNDIKKLINNILLLTGDNNGSK